MDLPRKGLLLLLLLSLPPMDDDEYEEAEAAKVLSMGRAWKGTTFKELGVGGRTTVKASMWDGKAAHHASQPKENPIEASAPSTSSLALCCAPPPPSPTPAFSLSSCLNASNSRCTDSSTEFKQPGAPTHKRTRTLEALLATSHSLPLPPGPSSSSLSSPPASPPVFFVLLFFLSSASPLFCSSLALRLPSFFSFAFFPLLSYLFPLSSIFFSSSTASSSSFMPVPGRGAPPLFFALSFLVWRPLSPSLSLESSLSILTLFFSAFFFCFFFALFFSFLVAFAFFLVRFSSSSESSSKSEDEFPLFSSSLLSSSSSSAAAAAASSRRICFSSFFRCLFCLIALAAFFMALNSLSALFATAAVEVAAASTSAIPFSNVAATFPRNPPLCFMA
mmetsp:Transcript_90274/g.180189  ORF Transcript_90274/g.180189 Transcript_90274/m.180189 type:complete len:390 (-) Transcript_90274:941-2110(-)